MLVALLLDWVEGVVVALLLDWVEGVVVALLLDWVEGAEAVDEALLEVAVAEEFALVLEVLEPRAEERLVFWANASGVITIAIARAETIRRLYIRFIVANICNNSGKVCGSLKYLWSRTSGYRTPCTFP